MEKWVSKIYVEEKEREEEMMLNDQLYQATVDNDVWSYKFNPVTLVNFIYF